MNGARWRVFGRMADLEAGDRDDAGIVRMADGEFPRAGCRLAAPRGQAAGRCTKCALPVHPPRLTEFAEQLPP
jgi:hypothetical protein